MQQTFQTLSDGNSLILMQRAWAMPNKNTFSIRPIRNLLTQEVGWGKWIDPFCNGQRFNNLVITNDLNPNLDADFHMDALDFLKSFESNSVDGVLYDPPYSLRQVSECYKSVGIAVTMETTQSSWRARHMDEIARVLRGGGTSICFGWNSNGVGKTRGMTMQRVLLVAHGGKHNDTIVTVEQK